MYTIVMLEKGVWSPCNIFENNSLSLKFQNGTKTGKRLNFGW